MLPLSDWPPEARRNIVGVFTDIDDTLTTDGAITPEALAALAALKAAGLTVIAITGRPVGWCEPFVLGDAARGIAPWPVDAIVAENGSVALLANKNELKSPSSLNSLLSKLYQQDEPTRLHNWGQMQRVAQRVLREIPGVMLSRDAAGRETDLAFDHAEYAALSDSAVQQVLAVLQDEGMHTSVSSIHVHGCFGQFDKWRGACWIAQKLRRVDLPQALASWVFVGDSGNDQAMFEHFIHSVGVANIRRFESQLTHLPRYISPSERGAGFAEVAQAILQAKK